MTTRSVLLRPGLYAMALCVGIGAFACSDDDDPPPPVANNNNTNNNNTNNNNTNNNTAQNIVEIASATPDLSSLVGAVTTAGLADALQADGPLTVFAPTNAAFAALGDAAPTDPELLANVLLHHVVGSSLDSAAVTTMGPFTTLAGTSLAVDAAAMPITVGGAALSSTLDIEASNGIVHIMDEVIVPPTILEAAQATADLSTLVTAVGAASQGVQDTLASAGPLTVFAPTNAAFTASGIDLATVEQAALDGILTYHVVSGQNTSDELSDGQTITMASGDTLTVNVSGGSVTLTDAAGNTVNVVTADLRLFNGVVHIIDGVLNPMQTSEPGNIVQVATDNGSFGTLLSAATRAGLVDALSGPGPLTVFAPTDAAFTALGVDLTPVADEVIGNILLQHVIGQDVPGTEVATSPTLTTLANLPLEVNASGDPITVGGANLSATIDVDADNGRIHVMDAVIVPPTILEVAGSLSDFSSLAAAVGQSSQAVQDALAPSTLTGEDPITVFAPTNAAFAAAGIDLATISQNELDRVLSHHAVAGQALAGTLTDGQVISTLNGDITVNIDAGNNVSLTDESGNTVNVIQTDIRTLTGVIHVIDGVLIPQPTIVDIAVEANFTELVGAVTTAGLADTLTTGGPFTVFAPSNAAFQALGTISPTVPVLQNILLHHVVPGTFDSTAVVGATSLTTAANTSLAVNATATPITIGGFNLGSTLDLGARNGIVHVMDQVIVPPTIVEAAVATPDLSTLVSALTAANLVGAVDPNTLAGDMPITVFAPTNAAFTAAGVDLANPPGNLSQILTYHVVMGQALSTDLTDGQVLTTVETGNLTVSINGGNVSLVDEQGNTINVAIADIRTLTGVVHVIDGVLLPN